MNLLGIQYENTENYMYACANRSMPNDTGNIHQSTLAELLIYVCMSMPMFLSILIGFCGVTLFGKPLSLFSL